uniref:(northern house mosquito) hypothetical protein n=1 Tax=Culex pipiens TaxID=7175 RepID=A0A8D8BGD1_CULPI
MTFSTRGHMKLPPAASWKTMLYLPRQDLRLPICNGLSRDKKLFRRPYWPVDQERARPTMTLPPPSLLFSLTKNTFSLFFLLLCLLTSKTVEDPSRLPFSLFSHKT